MEIAEPYSGNRPSLFDTVNSIAKFQVDTREMASSRFIRHAVSIDERRVKFQPVLFRPGTLRRTQSPDELTQLHVVNFGESRQSRQSIVSQVPAMHDDEDKEDDDDGTTDIQEVWFPGGHADIGGGWQPGDEEQWSLSHAPLVWMVHEAQWAGLRFDPDKLSQGGCWDGPSDLPIQPGDDTEEGEGATAPGSGLFDRLHLSATRGVLHNLLQFGQGLPPASVLLWRVMEYLPLGRMHLQADGSWNLVHWPLPCGAVRDIPKEAEIHASAIRRMQSDPNYRPGNLIGGGGGRAKRAPARSGIGEWTASMHEDDPVLGTYVKKTVRG